MPIHRPDTVLTKSSDGKGSPCGPFQALRFSDAGGLTQFGAFVEILPPGSSSSIKHWHAEEDEMVYMLEGELTLHEGDTTARLLPGEAATFKAGEARGHCLQNTSDAPAKVLIIGTRSRRETVTYPDHDRILTFTRDPRTATWTDTSGAPASNPYDI